MTARILVVDDIPANVKLLEVKLTAEYFDVVTAPDGPAAIERARSDAPDLILADVMMPGMDGFELCRSEEHTSELQSLMRISYAVFCLKKKKQDTTTNQY